MTEALGGDPAETERALLWSDARDILLANVATVGIQVPSYPPDYPGDNPTRIILAGNMTEPFDEDLGIGLYAEPSSTELIGKICVTYADSEEGDILDYEVTPDSIKLVNDETVVLGSEDIQDIRDRIGHAVWSSATSRDMAETMEELDASHTQK